MYVVFVTCNSSYAESCKICEIHIKASRERKRRHVSNFDKDQVKMAIYSSKYMEIRNHEAKRKTIKLTVIQTYGLAYISFCSRYRLA
jgi:hypothetical protein